MVGPLLGRAGRPGCIQSAKKTRVLIFKRVWWSHCCSAHLLFLFDRLPSWFLLFLHLCSGRRCLELLLERLLLLRQLPLLPRLAGLGRQVPARVVTGKGSIVFNFL